VCVFVKVSIRVFHRAHHRRLLEVGRCLRGIFNLYYFIIVTLVSLVRGFGAGLLSFSHSGSGLGGGDRPCTVELYRECCVDVGCGSGIWTVDS
jgi:hypothetical protein